jgi:hypothetical protein
MKKIAAIVYLVFLFAFQSCKDSSVNPSESKSPIIPFVLGNKWTYVDSLYTDSGIIVDTIVVTIDSMRYENSFTLWRFSHWFNPSIYAREFAVRNDSVFSLQYADGAHGLVPVRALEYLYPNGTDTAFYYSLYDGDVSIYKATVNSTAVIVIPANVFSQSIIVVYEVARELHREIVVPGIGMVDLDISNRSSISINKWWTRRRILLLHYELSQ